MAKRYIDAEAVEERLHALEAEFRERGNDDAVRACIYADIRIGAISAADVVERKRGEWIGYPESFAYEHVYDRDAVVCSCCEQSWNIIDNDTARFNFCPNCGADMREAT